MVARPRLEGMRHQALWLVFHLLIASERGSRYALGGGMEHGQCPAPSIRKQTSLNGGVL